MITTTAFQHKVQKLEDLYVVRTEANLRQGIYQKLKSDKDRSELATAGHIDDQDLLDRLLENGFDAQSLPALSLAPLAFIAWASGSVTPQERQRAMNVAFEFDAVQNQSVVNRFYQWLVSPPPASLFALWADYTRNKYKTYSPAQREVICAQLVDRLTSIAEASGGFLGFGSICEREQSVINKVQDTLLESFDTDRAHSQRAKQPEAIT